LTEEDKKASVLCDPFQEWKLNPNKACGIIINFVTKPPNDGIIVYFPLNKNVKIVYGSISWRLNRTRLQTAQKFFGRLYLFN